MLKDILQNWNIPFTDLLPNKDIIPEIAFRFWYKPEVLNPDYRGVEIIKDEEGNDVESQVIGRIETNSESAESYINRVLMDNIWGIVKPVIKEIMLAEQIENMRKAEELIDKQLDTNKIETK